MKVYVVTNVESGWDCVRGVYTNKESVEKYVRNVMEDKLADLDGAMDVIHEKTLKGSYEE